MKMFVSKWKGIGNWKFGNATGSCGFCQLKFDSACPSCSIPGDTCPLAIGVCSHQFHKHCLDKWLRKDKSNCPMCRQPWNECDSVMPSS
eukprot:TRINITY_DN920_c0_g3_i1.p1 TRINITY_DN920_c0_g3~~TRINITY_DN920_c0_g3_i1.p1  ORF type:complete len:104 (+),score=17.87 TRINITY_DN920_c0_g3_i1:47-313(+)